MPLHCIDCRLAVGLFGGLLCLVGGLRSQGAEAEPFSESVPAPPYRLVWEDDFNEEGPPNPENWTFEYGFVRNEELQWYQPENAFCEKGMLVIEARKEQIENPPFRPGHRSWRRNRPFADYSSACMTTKGKHQWKYGRFVIRAKIDARDGLWPAIWMLGSGRPWPGCGEIDIMEYYRGKILANACWLGREARPEWDSTSFPLERFGPGWADEFHVWQLDWNAEQLAISVDGRRLNQIPLDRAVNHDQGKTKPFEQPHFLLMNLAIGGTQGGNPEKTDFPARFHIDYVRVFQKQPREEARRLEQPAHGHHDSVTTDGQPLISDLRTTNR